jgi:hypothetical protein
MSSSALNRIQYSFYFKVPYTEIATNIDILKEITLKNFIDEFNTNHFKSIFMIHENYYVELVECGNNINGDAELAPALEPSELTLEEIYETRHNKVAFYVRPVIRETRQFTRRINYLTYPEPN